LNQSPHTSPPSTIELAVAAHVTLFVVGVSWAFGGNADWVRTPISFWGSLGILLTLTALALRYRRGLPLSIISWVWPVVVLNGIVAVSCLTPGFQYLAYESGTFMMPVRVDWWIPSAARTSLALRALWLFDGIYFSCLNLALVVSRRRTIRLVLAAVVANALALSIFGTIQKLVGSTGIYFGSVKSPQDYFFASFVYDNHWGAFIVLMTGACIGLILNYAHGTKWGGFFHGPALAGIVAAAFIGLSVPLSGSRAGTFLLMVLVAVAFVRGIPTVSRALRLSGATPAGALLGMAMAAILAAAGAWMVAGEAIQARAIKTEAQIAEIWAQRGFGSRTIVYRDTWRMARERILFGWGMGSYPSVFALYNSQVSKVDRLPIIYHDAHSDWLQSVAEIGLVGTALIGASVVVPVLSLRRSRLASISYFLLSGCVLIAAYALIEFPFGNVAVVLAWWLCFFGAIQYLRLSGPPKTAPPDSKTPFSTAMQIDDCRI
jgi:O-antigen ligase